MISEVRLPQWLDDYIYDKLKAKYSCTNSNMTVIDWDKKDVLNYLGTYFPRSYAESYCIFSEFFKNNKEQYNNKTELSIFDFGCGTGGEIIGLLTVLSEHCPKLKTINISALDGNQHALRLFENIIQVYQARDKSIKIKLKIIPLRIDDFYDLDVLNSILTERHDIFMSFKAICEFVTKERFEQQNAYAHIVKNYLPRLKYDGIMVLADVTTYNNVSQEWLPQMMDAGLAQVECKTIFKNEGYNQIFIINHKKRQRDKSKIAWRIITQ